MVTVFLADGFEEIEAVTPIDILRRGGVAVRTCSITSSREVTGAHGISVKADICLSELTGDDALYLLPGGMPGTLNLEACAPLRMKIFAHYQKGGLLAAICAAPTVFGKMGLLKNEKATCYPGMEKDLDAAEVSCEPVVVSSRFITSRGAGTAFEFALTLVSVLKGKEAAEQLSRAMCFKGE